MRNLRRILSALLVVCMVFTMFPATVTAADSAEPSGKRIVLDKEKFAAISTVWVDGAEYPVIVGASSCYVDLPEDAEPGTMVAHTYYMGDASDAHTQYPNSMKVWALQKSGSETYSAQRKYGLDNSLIYSGMSIRITGNKGVRMITSMEQATKNQLVSGNVDGYRLMEYGTVIAWASSLKGGKPLVLNQSYTKHNYAYKRDVADPVFNVDGSKMQYTNVLVGFTMDQCASDLCMRPYMILEDSSGKQVTLYGGTLTRSIGYIAWQNRNVYAPGTDAYNYVWEIIRSVYAEVTFQTNGGSTVSSAFVQKGSTLTKPADPVKDGYTFNGWYTDAGLKNKYNFSNIVQENMTLYAGWKEGSSDTCTVTFDSAGGSAVASQTVEKGSTIAIPANPTRTGYVFAGWYTDAGYTTAYDFDAAVTGSFTLYARWLSQADTDGDGLADGVEDVYHTDIHKPDTDGDGLSDYDEIMIGTDPNKKDTDGDGVLDPDEDADGDGLSNIDEIRLGTLPTFDDSDADGLKDAEEVRDHHTNPAEEDTDGDGASDGGEIELGTDPLSANRSFDVHLEGASGDTVVPSVDISLEGSQVDSLKIEAVADDAFFSDKVPGYMGKAYDFHVDGTFTSAKIGFEFDPDTLPEGSVPCIYYFNETTQMLEELTTSLEGNMAYTMVSHFSTYVLLNKTEFDTVWETEIKAPGTESTTAKTLRISFVIDVSGSMSGTNINTVKTVMKTFIGSMGAADQAAIVKFASSASVAQTLTTDKHELTNAVNGLYASGGTSIRSGVNLGIQQLLPDTLAYALAASEVPFEEELTEEDYAEMEASPEGEPSETEAETEPAEIQVMETESGEAEVIETNPVEVEAIETAPADTEEMATEPAETETAEPEAENPEPAEEEKNASDYTEEPVIVEDVVLAAASVDTYDVLILLTDGQDSGFNSYWSQYAKTCKDNDIIVYSIGIGNSVSSSHLTSFAEATGGKYYHATLVEELKDYFEEIKGETVDYTTDSNDDRISDYFTQKLCEGSLHLGTGKDNPFYAAGLSYEAIQAVKGDYDGDGILNGDELIVKYDETTGKVYIRMDSDPTKKDSDKDGYHDKKDANPMKWDISDRDLVMCASMSYAVIPVGSTLTSLSSSLKKEINERFVGSAGTVVGSVDEFDGWKVVDYMDLSTDSILDWVFPIDLQVATFKKDNNIVVAYRGTDVTDMDDWIDDINIYLGASKYTPIAKSYMKQVLKAYPNCNIYVTGHSLGGNLTYNAAAVAINKNADAVKGVTTFNGLGLCIGLTLFGDVWDEAQLLKKEYVIRDYRVDGDPVSRGPIGFTTFHYGTLIPYKVHPEAPGGLGILRAHSLYTFVAGLEPVNRHMSAF